MAKWTAFPYAGEFDFDAERVKKIGPDCTPVIWSPCPKTPGCLMPGHSSTAGSFTKLATLDSSLGWPA